ncbi:MAG: O-antigen ligase family protein [Daejeonella sp.]|uniref:O-antigen ligase family protein n=1 Tax=Daejeonella sp. TaxID=2805397 RepID=UPI003C70CB9C
MRQYIISLPEVFQKGMLLLLGLLIVLIVGFATAQFGFLVPVALIILAVITSLVVGIFKNPMAGFIASISYSFLFFILVREADGFPFGVGIELFLFLTLIATLVHFRSFDWSLLKNDFFYLTLFWFIISVLEIANPAGASVAGWMQEIRTSALYPLLFTFLAFLFFNKYKHLDLFLKLVIVFSIIAVIYGIRQTLIGLTPGEQNFLDNGGASTHLIWGRLRVFSFFSNASQFGTSQAHIGLIAFILALGPFKWWKKITLFLIAAFLLYGMLISGTRGALFALIVGGITAIFLSKNYKILIIGAIVLASGVSVLKFTTIGNGNYEIFRLRTALDPEDASLNTRFINQEILKDYLKSRPFGGGLGVSGFWGAKYNADKFLSTVPPDSYWVKVWVMYGVVGLVVWFSMMMYILGKGFGIIWKIQNKGLRYKLIALSSGAAGIFFASYGNEIMNDMPSSMIISISWAFIFMGPRLDRELSKPNQDEK